MGMISALKNHRPFLKVRINGFSWRKLSGQQRLGKRILQILLKSAF